MFSDKVKKAANKDSEIKDLHAKIGQLAVENDTAFYAAYDLQEKYEAQPDTVVKAAQDYLLIDLLHTRWCEC